MTEYEAGFCTLESLADRLLPFYALSLGVDCQLAADRLRARILAKLPEWLASGKVQYREEPH